VLISHKFYIHSSLWTVYLYHTYFVFLKSHGLIDPFMDLKRRDAWAPLVENANQSVLSLRHPVSRRLVWGQKHCCVYVGFLRKHSLVLFKHSTQSVYVRSTHRTSACSNCQWQTLQSPTFQPVVSHCTDWATWPTLIKIIKTIFTHFIIEECVWGAPKSHLWDHRFLQNTVWVPIL
jgi:hypothetical protein